MTFNPMSDNDRAVPGRVPNRPAPREERSGLLQQRIPGQAVIGELLAVQARARPRSRAARMFGAEPLSPDSRPWYQGAVGEIRVGHTLTGLGPEWTVLHAVPVGAGTTDIDHVLIGPAGVFTLNTKHHANQSVWVAGRTLMVAGHKQRHVANAAYEAARAAKLLSAAAGRPVPVTAVLVIVDAKNLTIREKPDHVAVVTERQLLRWLAGRRPVLASAQVARIRAVADRPGTWHRKPSDADDPAVLQCRFRGLQKQVDTARRRRITWAVGTAAVLCGFVTGLIPAVVAMILNIHAH